MQLPMQLQMRERSKLLVDYPFALSSPPSASQYTLLTQTGYDHYDGMAAAGSPLTKDFDNSYNNSTYINTTYNTAPLYALEPIQSLQTQGLATWTKVKTTATTTYFEYSVNIYDNKGRIIQQKRRNYTGGTSTTTTQYDWSGKVLRVVQRHHKALNTTHVSISVTDFSYDHAGRVTEIKKKIRNNLVNGNAMPAEWTVIASNQYNPIGQLSIKKIGRKRNSNGTYSTSELAKLDYAYNIRGWLLSINKPYISSTNADQYFAMEIGYDKDPGLGSFANKQYNGNISGIVWKSEGDQQRRKYDFTYDAANRLMTADFGQYASGSGSGATFNTDAGVNYSVEIQGYDANGNLSGMKQFGLKLNSSTLIDDLDYEVKGKSNRLRWVTDNITGIDNGKLGDFKDGSNGSADDYSYNANGSLNMDLNKDISSISYHNMVELPNIVTTTNGSVEYAFDVSGNKLWKKSIDNSISGKTTNITGKYVENFLYESKSIVPTDADNPDYSDKLQFATHEEGRIRALYNNATNPNTLTGFAYDYFIKDHLGNVRTVVTDELKDNIYPMATMETAQLANEEKYYANVNTTRFEKINISGYPADGATSPNDWVAKVNGSGNKIGPSILLKVMAGDKFNISATSWYKKDAVSPDPPTDLLTSLVAALAGGVSGVTSTHGTAAQLISGGSLDPSAYEFLSNRTAVTGGKPKAYLNWMFLDEQLKFSSSDGVSGVDEVGDDNSINVYPHGRTDIQIKKNGYFLVFVSNETPNINVFFDNLYVLHKRGPLLEETHYYPYGLIMNGISSNALNRTPVNLYKFNGIEQNNDFGLNMYDAYYRNLDPQLGRFWQIDPEAESAEQNSVYASMNNNPITNVDPLGDFTSRFSAWLYRALNGGGKIEQNQYGEYYVEKARGIETSADGVITLVTYKEYGEGRDQYSTLREEWIRDLDMMADIEKRGDKSLYKMYDSPEEKGNASLSYVNVLIPTPIMSSATYSANLSKVVQVQEQVVQKTLTIRKGVLQKFFMHAFAKGRHNDIGLPMDEMAAKGYNLVRENLSLLKEGDNVLITTINGAVKSFKAFVQNGEVTSINMYPGISNRVSQGNVVNLGNFTWW